MSSIIYKLACASILAYTTQAQETDQAFYRSFCKMENKDGDKIGRVTFKQDCTGEENLEDDTPVRLGAKISGLEGDQYSIQLFDSDPMEMATLEKEECLGTWFTNRKDSVRFMN